jgi:uncharacterized protein YaeQ
MAQKSAIFKADLQVADMDRNHYDRHALVMARHPSETDERMMLRLLAFAVHADRALSFGKGLSSDDEPDLWRRDLTGAIELWIDIGRPDEKRVRRACGRAVRVVVYSYGGTAAGLWWAQVRQRLEAIDNLSVFSVPPMATQALARLARRTMQLHCTVHDGIVSFADDRERVEIELAVVKPS